MTNDGPKIGEIWIGAHNPNHLVTVIGINEKESNDGRMVPIVYYKNCSTGEIRNMIFPNEFYANLRLASPVDIAKYRIENES